VQHLTHCVRESNLWSKFQIVHGWWDLW
jgi:hypothetical protein